MNTPKDGVGRLLNVAGRPPEPPAHVLAGMRQAGRAAWEVKLAEQRTARRRRRLTAALLAASVLAAVGVLVLLQRPERTPVAMVEAWRAGDGFAPGADVLAGTRLEMGTGERAILRLLSGTILRLDQETRLTLTSASAVELHGGAIYLDCVVPPESPQGDSGSDDTTAPRVEIHTPFGVVRDIGTRFLVRLRADELDVRVRDGLVRLQRTDAEGSIHDIPAGTGFTLRVDGSLEQREAEPSGPAWDWIQDMPAPFVLEGATVGAYLEWLAGETGWQVRYEDDALARELAATVSRGSLPDVRPEDTLDTVLVPADLVYRLEGGVFVIARP